MNTRPRLLAIDPETITVLATWVAGSDQTQFQWRTACPRVWALTSRKNRCIVSIRLGDLLWPFLVCLSLILSRAAIF